MGASGGTASTPKGGCAVKGETGDTGRNRWMGASPQGDPVKTLVDPVVQRFAIPRQPEGLLPRARLFEDLELGVGGALTLVSAPAGCGKTVLVSSWASRAQAKRPVAWVTVEATDERLTGFWWSFTQGLSRCGVVAPLSPALTGWEGAEAGVVDVVGSALSERAEPVVVVLDCESEISAAVAKDLDIVVRRSGGRLRLVVVTRVDPALHLHRFRLAGTLVEIRMADLAFTLDEARELMTRAGVELPDPALRSVVDRCQGWAAGLRFAAVAIQQAADQERAAQEFRGDTGNVAEYLIAEVLDANGADSRRLLLETSIVDILRPGLSEALAGPSAHAELTHLAHGNAFLSEVPNHPGCYRYQPLFHELLRARLATELPARVAELHRDAAAWMFDHGFAQEAIRHAVAAGDWEGAAGFLVDDLAIGRLLMPGEDALATALARMPDDTPGPAASLVRAALAMAALDVEACEAHLLRAEGLLDGGRAARLSTTGLALQTVRLAHCTAVASPDRGLGAAVAAERLMQRQVSERVDEHPELSVLIQASKGGAWLMKGHLDDAVRAFTDGVHAAARPGCERLLVSCLGHLALIEAMRGQLRKAVDFVDRAAAAAREARIDAVECPSAAVALAWVNTELYDLPAARRQVQRAAESITIAQDPTSRVMLALVDSRVRRARGDVDGALAALVTGRCEIPQAPAWLGDVLSIEEAELHIANGQPERAVEVVGGLTQLLGSPESALVLARAKMATGGTFESPATTSWSAAASLPTRVAGWLFETSAQLDAGKELRAVQALERSLRLAAPDRLRRPFREASPQVRQLLRGERQLTAEHSWLGAATLDDAHPPPSSRREGEPDRNSHRDPAPSPILESLTEKEREVLGHLAELLTTDEIAGSMFVSVNTVRTHVRNILRKLAASRRNEAVRRARELGIIPGWSMQGQGTAAGSQRE